MKKATIALLSVVMIAAVCYGQSGKSALSFTQIFPPAKQRQMGLHKLTTEEKETLRLHVISLLVAVAKPGNAEGGGGAYAGVGGGHWVQKNIDSGTYITLEDGSLWKIDPLDKINAMLWLPISDITVTESSSGSPGYDYLLINTDDGEKAHAKHMGQK